MTTITFSKKDFDSLLGKKLTPAQLEDAVLYAKAELDGIEGDVVTVEISDTNRPDMWSLEGLVRTIKPFYGGKYTQLPTKIPASGITVHIESSVKNVRPFTVCGVAKNINVTAEVLDQLIQLQEKVCMGFGRKRKEAAIGVYDLDQIKSPIRYYGADPKTEKFAPLGFEHEMTLEDILELHPKGIEFKNLLAGHAKYPLFKDAAGKVLSMPPIINSNESGQVEVGKRNLFIEVSGFNLKTLSTTLNVMMAALHDRGAKLESVTVVDSNGKKIITPDVTPKKLVISGDSFRMVAGLALTDTQILSQLKKMHYNGQIKGKKIELTYPVYRQDLLHEMDAVEDALIACDFNTIKPEPLKVITMGGESVLSKTKKRAREALVGLGLQEIATYHLTSIARQRTNLNLPESEHLVEIENFVSQSYQLFKRRAFPELLGLLADNNHVELPHEVFELARVIQIDAKEETGVKETEVVNVALERKNVSMNDARAVLQSYAKAIGFSFELKSENQPFAIPGRCAGIYVNQQRVGCLFEVHPTVLEKFKIENPVAVFELELDTN